MPGSHFGGFGFSWLPRLKIGGFGDDVLMGTHHRDLILGLFGDDEIAGKDGDDLLFGGFGDDLVDGGLGNDAIDGGKGTDTAVFAGDLADYTIDNSNPHRVIVSGPDGTDVLRKVEFLQFDDQVVDLRPRDPVINEFSVSTAGTDVEYVEILAMPNADLSNLTLLQIEGDGGASLGRIDTAHALGTAGSNGIFLLEVAANTFENGTLTLLLVEDFTGAVGDDIDADDDGVIDLAPWAGVVDDIAVWDGGGSDLAYASTVLDESFDDAVLDNGFAPGGASRIPDGTDTDTPADWVRNDFDLAGIPGEAGTQELGEALNTPGAPNALAEDGGGGVPLPLTIMEIQGAGHVSSHVGVLATTSGVVTAVDSNGFYMQDPAGDGDIATSDGIFVFTGAAPAVAVGDAVDVTGTVSEFTPGGVATGNLSTTQLGGGPVVTITGPGAAVASTLIGAGGRVPPTETIDDDAFGSFDATTDGIDFFESMEGMLVTAQDLLAISGTNRFGEIFAVVDDGLGATGLSARETLNISPDDFNPERIQIQADSDILASFVFPDVDTGDDLGDVTGVVGYDFGNFEIKPTQAFAVTPGGLAPETTTLFGDADQLSVASYNVLNLDPNEADGDTDIADGRFDTIAQQIVDAMGSPDIIGLQEIQDNTGADDDGVTSASATLDMLVAAINALTGSTYAWIDNTFIGDNLSGGQPGANIRTAFLYNTDRVDLVPGSVGTIGGQGAGEAFEGARLPLVADFTFNGETVTVVNNHLSSKSGSAPILGVEQPFEARQEDPTVNGSLDERQAQAQAVKDFVDGLVAADADAKVIVLGDMNEFEFVSPLGDILAADTGADLTNLADLVAAAESADEIYSFIFQGNSQALDHILATENLVQSGTADQAELDYVHVNSEFAETATRASDHDPLVALFTIPEEVPVV